jgi:cytochrome c-type biogenesis protein CcmH
MRRFSLVAVVGSHAVTMMTAVVVLLAAGHASGQAPAGAELEREARAIEAMLIAPCCFSQQVSVHQSPAAEELRQDIRRRLAAGETRQQILDAYEKRYGTRVLAEPPARGFSVALYVIPPLLFLASIGLVVMLVRRFTSPGEVASGAAGESRALGTATRYEPRLDEELRDLD